MRRLLGLVLLCSSLALIAASPSPSPKPLPAATLKPAAVTPVPAATAPTSGAPSVIIYPFDQSGELPPKTGVAIAQIFSQAMVGSGNVTVLPIGEAIKRPDFRTNAQKVHADYYISGYVTPVGQGAAVVQQLVSVDSGVIVYSNTAQIYSVPDVASQALNSRQVILQLSGRQTEVSSSNSASATPTPGAKNGAEVNVSGVGNILQNLFHRGPKTNSTTAAAATPAAKPDRGVFVARVSGSAGAGELTAATAALTHALDARYNAKSTTADSSGVQKTADTVCGAARNNTIATAQLTQQREGTRYSSRNVNVFTLTVYTCFGAQLYSTTTRDSDLTKAVDAAVAAYAKDHPDNS